MPATYRCSSCNSTWNANREPTGCPNCGSRTVELWGHSGAQIEEFYEPPQAAFAVAPRVSTTAFAICFWLGYVGITAGYFALVVSSEPTDPGFMVGVASVLVSAPCLLAAFIMANVKIYRGWKLIQPLRRMDRAEIDMTTPGVAAGLLWIPLFQLYWNFVALYGLSTRANKYMLRSGIDAQPMNEGLAKACCILFACSAIPCVNILTGLPNLVIYHLVILDIDRMRSAILEWQAGGSKVEFVDDLDEL